MLEFQHIVSYQMLHRRLYIYLLVPTIVYFSLANAETVGKYVLHPLALILDSVLTQTQYLVAHGLSHQGCIFAKELRHEALVVLSRSKFQSPFLKYISQQGCR